jgi:aryl-phospho-beta-D-glucosidase BglC (GH1 family)
MKKNYRSLLIYVVVCIISSHAFSQENTSSEDIKEWWEADYRNFPEENPRARTLPLIKVAGNKFVNSKGDTLIFRGLGISDPDKIEDQGHWNKAHFEKVKDMGANVVRIPVHPVAWRDRTPEEYLRLLERAADWCTELGLYIIIDWHSIGNLHMELFQNTMYNTTRKETYEFWRSIAFRFKGNNTIAFYELFNEPTQFNGLLGNMSWQDWKEINEDIIKLIRAYDRETIPLVAGFDWAYDLTYIRYNPIDAEGIGYVTHPYPMKRKPPWPDKWEENFGFAADKYPVFATEIGFRHNTDEVIDKDHYGYIILDYLERRNISWTAWVFDPDWHPHMLTSWETYELTPLGKFFRKSLQGINENGN